MTTSGQPTNGSGGPSQVNRGSGIDLRQSHNAPQPAGAQIHAMLHVTAEVIHLASHIAKAFGADPKLKDLFYGVKHSLLSMLLLATLPDVAPSWDPNSGRQLMLIIRIGSRRCVHCPFQKLSWPARCKVIERIGVRPW